MNEITILGIIAMSFTACKEKVDKKILKSDISEPKDENADYNERLNVLERSGEVFNNMLLL